MESLPSTEEDPNSGAHVRSRHLSIGRGTLALCLIAFGVFYMMLAMGGASFVHECNTVVCGQLHQAVFAAIGGVALWVAAYRLLIGESSIASTVFFGTIPILIVHVILVVTASSSR
jgi:hypothetical protein